MSEQYSEQAKNAFRIVAIRTQDIVLRLFVLDYIEETQEQAMDGLIDTCYGEGYEGGKDDIEAFSKHLEGKLAEEAPALSQSLLQRRGYPNVHFVPDGSPVTEPFKVFHDETYDLMKTNKPTR